MASFLDSVSIKLFELIGKNYKESGVLQSDILHSLYMIHGKNLVSALDLIDHKKISTVESPSGRKLFRIIGTSGSYYTCFMDSFYCQCPSFKFGVLKRKDTLMCKHIIAAKLASNMEIVIEKEISDDAIEEILMEI